MESPERPPITGLDREVDELVEQCLSAIDRTGESAIEELCERHPQHAEILRRRIRLLRDAGLLGHEDETAPMPERMGDFRLLRRLGGGGMGVVYLAEQSALGRRVALKLVRPEHLYFPGARARFAREAQAVARLAHPGIVQVHTVGEESGVPYIAMEFVDGITLSEVLVKLRGRTTSELRGSDLLELLSPHRADEGPESNVLPSAPFAGSWADSCAWIGRELAQALEHAHQRGVVHRDIKPSNIMLTAAGRVLLVDFGLASATGVDQLTRTGSAMGSLPYMAPEQVSGRNQDIGPLTDVYGLGVTLYELLSLRRPFDDSNESALRAAILAAQPPRLTAISPHAPRDLEAVISVAMAPEPSTRYRRAADLARDLSHVLAREPIEARPANALERARRWAKRHPARALAGVLLGVIVVGGPLGFGVVQRQAAAKERELGRELGAANILAESRNTDLLASNRELERKRADLAQALSNETKERERAVENFATALDAVDTMLTRVGADTLEDVPQMEGVRRELLEDALRFYGRFFVQGADDPNVQLRSAVTQRKVSIIREELGDLVAARDAAQAAVTTMRELETHHTDLRDLPDEICRTLAQYGSTLLALQDLSSAETIQRELISRLEKLQADPGHAEFARKQLATVEQHLAFLLRDTGRIDEGIEHARRAAELLRPPPDRSRTDLSTLHRAGESTLSLAVMGFGRVPPQTSERELIHALELMSDAVKLAPDNPRTRLSLASAHSNLGLFLSPQELDHGYQPSGANAEQSLRRAIEIYDDLIARFPLRALYRTGIASASINLCVHLARSGNFAEARTFGELAIEATAALVDLAPESADHRSLLGAALSNVAPLDLQDGLAEQALSKLDRAFAELTLAIELEPKNPAFAGQMREWHVARVLTLLALGRWSDTVEQVQRFEEQNRDEMARLWAIESRVNAITLATRDSSTDPEHLENVGRMRDETVSRLRALVAGGFDVEKLRRMKALEPLHDHAGFVELVRATDRDQ